MHPHAALIESFYRAFQQRDHAAMAACYVDECEFSDPVFRRLRGAEVAAMWRMLCERATELEITYSDIWADDTAGGARWEAKYPFSAAKRPVHNVVNASFRFNADQISSHQDDFSFWRWSSCI